MPKVIVPILYEVALYFKLTTSVHRKSLKKSFSRIGFAYFQFGDDSSAAEVKSPLFYTAEAGVFPRKIPVTGVINAELRTHPELRFPERFSGYPAVSRNRFAKCKWGYPFNPTLFVTPYTHNYPNGKSTFHSCSTKLCMQLQNQPIRVLLWNVFIQFSLYRIHSDTADTVQIVLLQY